MRNTDTFHYSSEVRIYRAGVGVIYSSGGSNVFGAISTRTSTLVSFSNEVVGGLRPTHRMAAHTVRQHIAQTEKRLSLPCLIIVRGNRMFDLQGRTGRRFSDNRRIRPLLSRGMNR
jgi:hypothetical protein